MIRIAKVVLVLAAGILCTAWSGWSNMDPEDGRIGLTRGGDEWVAEGYSTSTDRQAGHVYHFEQGWWGYEDTSTNRVEVRFDWGETLNRGWSNRWTGKTVFFDVFNATDSNYSERNATPGPVIETVLGQVETVGFDLDDGRSNTYGEDKRRCLGFTVAWGRSHSFGITLYNKTLHVFACRHRHHGRMPKSRFQNILKGLSIEGEFDALIED